MLTIRGSLGKKSEIQQLFIVLLLLQKQFMLITEESENTCKQTNIKNANHPTHEPTIILILKKEF